MGQGNSEPLSGSQIPKRQEALDLKEEVAFRENRALRDRFHRTIEGDQIASIAGYPRAAGGVAATKRDAAEFREASKGVSRAPLRPDVNLPAERTAKKRTVTRSVTRRR